MCGRFACAMEHEDLAEALDAEIDPDLFAVRRMRFNVAPADVVPILRLKEDQRLLTPARWGLVPHWASAPVPGRNVNARAETLVKTPTFRDAFSRHRCLVPSTGFYEWGGPKGARRPYYCHPPDGGIVLLAGVFDNWRDPETGEWQRTFAIVTTGANERCGEIHDRMPVIVPPDRMDQWLSGTNEEALSLLVPAPEEDLVLTAVSPRVNATANDDPACLDPWVEPPGTLPLFGEEGPKKKR